MAKKTRIRLYDYEAQFLGIEPNKKSLGENKARYSLSDNQLKKLDYARDNGIIESCNNLQVDPTTVKHLWKKTKKESVFVNKTHYLYHKQKKLT